MVKVDHLNYKDYQEIKIQVNLGNLHSSMLNNQLTLIKKKLWLFFDTLRDAMSKYVDGRNKLVSCMLGACLALCGLHWRMTLLIHVSQEMMWLFGKI